MFTPKDEDPIDNGRTKGEDILVRISLRLKEFFKEGDALTLQNLLEFLGSNVIFLPLAEAWL